MLMKRKNKKIVVTIEANKPSFISVLGALVFSLVTAGWIVVFIIGIFSAGYLFFSCGESCSDMEIIRTILFFIFLVFFVTIFLGELYKLISFKKVV